MKTIKNILLVGNDWLLHVVLGVLFVWKFSWWGVPLAFISHFPVDAVPHGHHENNFLDALKGILLGVGVLVWVFPLGFVEMLKYGTGMFFSINFDFLLAYLAKPWDKKKDWENKPQILSKLIFTFTKTIIWINFFCHWFTKGENFKKIWKEEEKFNCLPNQTFHALKPSWWNLAHLTLAITILIVW